MLRFILNCVPYSRNGSVVRGRHALKKIHEVDVPFAGSFDIPAGIDTVHAGVNHDFEQLTR